MAELFEHRTHLDRIGRVRLYDPDCGPAPFHCPDRFGFSSKGFIGIPSSENNMHRPALHQPVRDFESNDTETTGNKIRAV